MPKIPMTVPIAELDGDEMTRVLWRMIKEILIEPYVELKTEYYDLGLKNRDDTDDGVTIRAAEAIKRLKVGVKCATITPNLSRVEEYGLKKCWKSPNATIRSILDGTVFRSPITVEGISPLIPGWKQPITVARHAYGDIYSATELTAKGGDCAQISVGDVAKPVHNFTAAGVVQCVYNSDASIEAFARSCFEYGLENGLPVWFGAKDTVSAVYDARFKEIFNKVYGEYAERFESKGLYFLYSLIDDIVARAVRSFGGFLWACKNYDGDVISDMVATAFGSLGLMSSVLVSPDGCYEYEAAHGTVTKHYMEYLKGNPTSTNPCATIRAWTGALNKRGELDGNRELCGFAKKLENATQRTIQNGFMTGDLVPLFKKQGVAPVKLTSEQFLERIAENL